MPNTLLPDLVCRASVETLVGALVPGRDLEETDKKGRTAVFRSARVGRLEHLRVLLGAGASPNASDKTGEAPLQTAARNGHTACVELLLQSGADIDYCPPPELTEYSESALCSAVRKSPEAAFLLLEHGADPNAGTAARRLPLSTAVGWDKGLPLIEELINRGADVNAADAQGMTPLHFAAERGTIPIIKTLLDAGANPNAIDDRGEPLICSAVFGLNGDRPAVILSLLAGKPDLSLVSPGWQKTALELAIHCGHKEIADILRAAGSPAARPGGWSWGEDDDAEEEIVLQGEDEMEDVSIVFTSSRRLKPTSAQSELARGIVKTLPSLAKNGGWEASPRHWAILEALDTKPIPLERIAYFVRGWYNKPEGKELLDGPSLLGESYQTAIDRFVELGLACVVEPDEAVSLTSPLKEIKAVAKAHGLPVSGAKAALISRIVKFAGIDALVRELPPRPHFKLSEAGRDCLSRRDAKVAGAESELRARLVELLTDGEFTWACHIARDLELLLNSRSHIWSDESLAGRCIAEAEKSLNAALPDDLDTGLATEQTIRAIAAGATLVGDWRSSWKQWGAELPEPAVADPRTSSPDRLARFLAHEE